MHDVEAAALRLKTTPVDEKNAPDVAAAALDRALLAEEAAHPRSAARLWAKIPPRRYVCFYPMNKKRGERVNWYGLPYQERARMMLEHGKIGRSFHGLVTQVISGSTAVGAGPVFLRAASELRPQLDQHAAVQFAGFQVTLKREHRFDRLREVRVERVRLV